MTEFVYLHGFASGPSSKKALAFKNKFKEIGVSLNTPDLEGGNFENMTLTSQVNIVLDLLDQFQCKKVCLIGSSMGGYLATLLAQRRVEIKATYLMAPGFNFLERWMRSLKLDFDDETCWDEKFSFPEFSVIACCLPHCVPRHRRIEIRRPLCRNSGVVFLQQHEPGLSILLFAICNFNDIVAATEECV